MKQINLLQATKETVNTLRRTRNFFPSKDMTMGKKIKAQEDGFGFTQRQQNAVKGPFDVEMVDDSHIMVFNSLYPSEIGDNININGYGLKYIMYSQFEITNSGYFCLIGDGTNATSINDVLFYFDTKQITWINSNISNSKIWIYMLAMIKAATQAKYNIVSKINAPSFFPSTGFRYL